MSNGPKKRRHFDPVSSSTNLSSDDLHTFVHSIRDIHTVLSIHPERRGLRGILWSCTTNQYIMVGRIKAPYHNFRSWQSPVLHTSTVDRGLFFARCTYAQRDPPLRHLLCPGLCLYKLVRGERCGILVVGSRQTSRQLVCDHLQAQDIYYLTVVKPAIKVLFAWVTARMVLSAVDSRVTWSSQGASA
jgi:hypothetical protein